MRPNQHQILFFLSEILAAKTLAPVVRRLAKDARYRTIVINDGFCTELVSSLGLGVEVIGSRFEARIGPLLDGVSLVVTGKSYCQPSEYAILREAAARNLPVLVSLPDLGFDVVDAKLRGCDGSGGFPPPRCLLADPMTHASLLRRGWATDRLVAAGSPHFDVLYARSPGPGEDSRLAAYISTAFEQDHVRGILDVPYSQRRYIRELAETFTAIGLNFVARRHTQVPACYFDGIPMTDEDSLALMLRSRIVVGSYSTALLEAYVAGVPVVSYQPWPRTIRADVFAGRIPIAKNLDELNRIVGSLLEGAWDAGRRARRITYYAGASLSRYVEVIAEAIGAEAAPRGSSPASLGPAARFGRPLPLAGTPVVASP